jgi:hypothetical protein
MDAKDQAVLDRLAKLDILAVPTNATPIDQTSEKGGGADPFIRTASTYTVVYFLPRPPLQVRDKFLARFPRWDLLDDGPPLANLWRALGRMDSSDTVVAVNVRTPAPADDAPDPNGSGCDGAGLRGSQALPGRHDAAQPPGTWTRVIADLSAATRAPEFGPLT